MNIDVAPGLERSSGCARLSFKAGPTGSVLEELYQQGCSKIRFPVTNHGFREAVLLNTAGGLADGDTITTNIHWRNHTRALVTTQAAERVYRAASGDVASVTTRIRIEEDSVACWLPQETIIFDGARLSRSLEIDVASTGRLFALESTVFGRHAMGEVVNYGRVSDRWRVSIDGRLTFADHFLVDDNLNGQIDSYLNGAPVIGTHRCMATVVIIANEYEELVDGARTTLATSGATVGTTCLDRLGVIRILANDSYVMRNAVAQLVASLDGPLKLELPRVWHC